MTAADAVQTLLVLMSCGLGVGLLWAIVGGAR